jgi:hydrogenase maturation protein HypF
VKSPPAERRRIRARVQGTVQGVGFRPYVFRLAEELELGGYVLNDERGVLLEVEGRPDAVEGFLVRLPAEAPPLASIERVTSDPLEPTGDLGFEIVESESHGEAEAAVSPDMTTCDACLAEVFDPSDRRHRYPFTNCTNCGPRFTIVRGVPYDRPLTTMAAFEMCERCRAEYEDPRDRRFHAQPNACPACGPRAWLASAEGEEAFPGEDQIAAAARELAAGRILAIKGLGGFHLACRADDEPAVAALRSRKHREQKPFALMAPDARAASELIELDGPERELIAGRERPIVIGRRRDRGEAAGPVAASVAPRSADLGVMLPYSPLHHLLLSDLGAAAEAGASLVMTSGNVSDEPIAYEDGDALERLAGIADLFLLHDRPIQTRTDDSVVRALGPAAAAGRDAGGAAGQPGTGGPLLMRRSRGYVPASLPLPIDAPSQILACGAELKNTFCLAKGGRAWVGHHVGDLENFETLRSFSEGIEHFQELFAITPEVIAHDLHPEYLSTKYALERRGVRHLGVQHHHAHMAACLGEHGEAGPAIGAIYDGTGFGPDQTVWGGELLVGDPGGYRRAGMLWPVRLPGGAAAIREPWRMACAWLAVASGEEQPPVPAALAGEVDERRWREVCELVRTGVASPPTTSVGRLFDAVAAICGLRPRVSYEGQAAAELEAIADPAESGAYPLPIVDAGAEPGSGAGEGMVLLDARELVRAVRDAAAADSPVATISARFHNAIAEGTARACAAEAERRGLGLAVLSGGVFQNRLLLERTCERLAALGPRVLVPRRLPPNDGGISYGQAVVAAASP